LYHWIESEARLNRQAARITSADAAFTVHYWGLNPRHFSNSLHKHSFFEICYVLSGEGTYLDDGVLYPLSQGSLFCSRPDITHQIQSFDGMQLIYVAFELDESKCSDEVRSAFQLLAETTDVCKQDGNELPSALLWRSLLIQSDGQPAIPESSLPDLARALLFSFVSLFGRRKAADRPSVYRSSALILKQAKLYIRDNLSDDDLSLGKVAAHMNVSSRHLSRIFSTHIYESYSQYVRLQRVRQAAHLLRHSELSIKAVAEETGFGSVHYFTRTFRALMNTTPARFREEATAGV
jgi:AraC-like DNA-binding protein/mannose-6-phosphate isomerase-like protein (cupin superfamily)